MVSKAESLNFTYTFQMQNTQHIIDLEETLLKAVQHHDIDVLDGLLHDNLLFNAPDGQTYTKAQDIAMHRSGEMVVNSITASDRIINRIDDGTFVIATTIETTGSIGDFVMDGTYRYLRVWKALDESWKIVAGSCIAL
jgi:hypothetical protein